MTLLKKAVTKFKTAIKYLTAEFDLSPLHLVAYSGSENVVRALLNSSGVPVEAANRTYGYTALHLR